MGLIAHFLQQPDLAAMNQPGVFFQPIPIRIKTLV